MIRWRKAIPSGWRALWEFLAVLAASALWGACGCGRRQAVGGAGRREQCKIRSPSIPILWLLERSSSTRLRALPWRNGQGRRRTGKIIKKSLQTSPTQN